jgi:hypothetical protein
MGETVVTPEQLHEGYWESSGHFEVHRNWRIIRQLDDGNYLVAEYDNWIRDRFMEKTDDG